MELFELGPLAWTVAFGVVLVGAILQGALGFGLGLIAAPILVLLDNRLVPGVVLGMSLPLALLVAWRERHWIDARLIRWAVVGRVPGAVVGSLAVVVLDTRSLAIFFAVAILVALAVSLAGVSIRQTNATMLGAGFVSGVTGTATSIGGPPMALVLQQSSGPVLRASMSMFMAFGSLASIILLVAVGEFGARDLGITALLIPALLAGFFLSAKTNQHLDRGHTRTAVLVVAATSAIAILVRTL